MNLRRLAPALSLLAFPILASPVAADCQAAGPIEDELAIAPVAFVGRVIDIDGSVATFAVAEVWAGSVAPEVEVHGLFTDRGRDPEVQGSAVARASDVFDLSGDVRVMSEDDRVWWIGGTYLVVPTVDGNVLRDSICTATTLWSDELASLRPATAQMITTEGYEPVSMPIIPIGLGAAALLAVSLLAFRRRSR